MQQRLYRPYGTRQRVDARGFRLPVGGVEHIVPLQLALNVALAPLQREHIGIQRVELDLRLTLLAFGERLGSLGLLPQSVCADAAQCVERDLATQRFPFGRIQADLVLPGLAQIQGRCTATQPSSCTLTRRRSLSAPRKAPETMLSASVGGAEPSQAAAAEATAGNRHAQKTANADIASAA